MAMNTTEYIMKARECGIMVGDRVLITRKAKRGENGWYSGWSFHMDKTIGETGQVRVITDRWNFVINFDNGDFGNYPYFVLKRVYRSPIVPRFTIGDQVLVKRAWKYGECGTHIGFDEGSITETIGGIGEVVEIIIRGNYELAYYLKFDEDEDLESWLYPEFVLREVTNKPNPDFEFEPFDGLLHITGPTLSR